MARLWHFLGELGSAPLAQCFKVTGLGLCLWAAVTLLRLLVELFESFGPHSRWNRVGVGLLAMNTCLGVTAIQRGRWLHISIAQGGHGLDPAQAARVAAEAMSAQLVGLGFWAISTLVGVGALALSWLVHRKRQTAPVWAWLSLGLVTAVAVSSLLRVDEAMYGGCHGDCGPHWKELRFLETAHAAGATTQMTQWAVVVLCVAVLGVVGLLWRLGRVANHRAPQLGSATAVFVLGGLAFWATRGMAYDTRRLVMPRLQPPYSGIEGCGTPGLPRWTPAAGAEAVDAPGLTITGRYQAQVWGTPYGVEEALEIVSNRKDLWIQLHPDQVYAGWIVLAVPADMLMREVQPWLDALRELGFTRPLALLAAPQEVLQTRTLGALQRTPTCVTLPVDGSAATKPTWGAYVRTSMSRSNKRRQD